MSLPEIHFRSGYKKQSHSCQGGTLIGGQGSDTGSDWLKTILLHRLGGVCVCVGNKSSTSLPQSGPAMSRTLWLFAATLLLTGEPVSGGDLFAFLGDSVNFTASQKCADGETFKLTTSDNKRTVATFIGGVWTAEGGYEGRIRHLSAFSVLLASVNYNDNGLYEFTCGGRPVTATQLKAVPFTEVRVTEGGTATLPCHSLTAGRAAGPVRWERSGEDVAEPDPSGKIRFGAEFAGRVNVSSDWCLKGDVSLIFERVEAADQGDFICHAKDERGIERPVGVRMKVDERDPGRTTCPPPPESPTHTEMGAGAVVGISAAAAVCLLIAALGVVVWFCWWLKSRRPNGPRGGRPATGVEMEPFTAGPDVNGPPRLNPNGY